MIPAPSTRTYTNQVLALRWPPKFPLLIAAEARAQRATRTSLKREPVPKTRFDPKIVSFWCFFCPPRTESPRSLEKSWKIATMRPRSSQTLRIAEKLQKRPKAARTVIEMNFTLRSYNSFISFSRFGNLNLRKLNFFTLQYF